MPKVSQTAGWASDSPTPAQLKEFFAQVSSGRITKDRLQGFLRGADQVEGDWFSFTTTAASLKEMRDQNPELFYSGNDWWFSQPFAKKRGKAGRKLQIRTSAVPGSFSKTFAEQQGLLSDGEFVPTARDLIEGAIAYYRETGKRLFFEYWVRTEDVSTCGSRVYVRFRSGGVGVFYGWGDSRSSRLGLAVARKS